MRQSAFTLVLALLSLTLLSQNRVDIDSIEEKGEIFYLNNAPFSGIITKSWDVDQVRWR